MKKLICLLLILIPISFCSTKQEKTEMQEIDGIVHILNKETPLRRMVELEIEKTREIDPYKFENISLRFCLPVRSRDGEVILYDPNDSEVHRFNADGTYAGKLVRVGQGPGEFSTSQSLKVHYMGNQIWVTSSTKLAKFDRNGNFLEERRLNGYPEVFVDEIRFISSKRIRTKKGGFSSLILVDLDEDEQEATTIFEADVEGMIRFVQGTRTRAFTNDWGVPKIVYTFSEEYKRVYLALNTDYKIYVKNPAGDTLYVINRPYNRIRVGIKEKEMILGPIVRNEAWKWMLDAYPDTLVAIKDLKTLPNGYLAVYRVSGVKQFEIDVYDPEGKYVYLIKIPEDLVLEREQFFDIGFFNIEPREDFRVYVEYRIKNLPEIFRNN